MRITPAETFGEVKKDEGVVPPGLIAIAAREDLRPLDLVVAAVAEDLGPGTATAAAVTSERETCISLVMAQIGKVLGEDQALESAARELDEVMERHEALEAELARLLEADGDADTRELERKIAEAEEEVARQAAKVSSAELLDEVLKAIEARRPPEPDVDATPPAPPTDATP